MAGGSRIIAFGPGGHEGSSVLEGNAGEAHAGDEFLLTQELTDTAEAPPDWDDADAGPAVAAPWREWIAPVLAIAVALAWTGFFAYSRRAELVAATPREWTAQLADWALPLVLLAVAWLIAMRSSRREAVRFGDAAALLSAESARLETRLTAVNRELSLAREFIAAQSRDLEALGRIAADRLSHNADRLQALIHSNGEQVDAIGTVSSAALENMEKLRGQLPVIASSAKDVTNNIAGAGRTAHAQIEDMINGFKRINEFGQASERQVRTLRDRIDEALNEFAIRCEALDEMATDRFAALTSRSAEFRTRLDSDEVEALAAIRTRAAAMASELEQTRQLLDSHEGEALVSVRARMATLRDETAAIGRALRDTQGSAIEGWQSAITRMDVAIAEASERLGALEAEAKRSADARALALDEQASRFEASLIERRDAAAQADSAMIDALAQRLAALDADLAGRRTAQAGHVAALEGQTRDILDRLDSMQERMAGIATEGGAAEARIAAALATLGDHLAGSRSTLAEAEREIATLTEGSVRLLELIQATVQHSRDQIPEALAASEQSLTGAEERVLALGTLADAAARRGDELAARVRESRAGLDSLAGDLAASREQLEALGSDQTIAFDHIRQSLAAIDADNARIAAAARGELASAIEALSSSAHTGIAAIDEHAGRAVALIGHRLEQEAAVAVERAITAGTDAAAGSLDAAVARATASSREAAVHLRDQFARIDALAGNLEARVGQARQRAEEQVDNEFSRRAALITESLNSHAIDIAKALSSDVADTAWAAYLRGDRGIFTRRAVSLIDANEARSITQLYEDDREFREHVSRYIHDFEAILRQILSTRDGHALGVTLLSSDMGKLYVALAQAIERLRN